MANKKFVMVKLINGEVEEITANYPYTRPTIGIDYNSELEAYINKAQIQHLHIDEEKKTIYIAFQMASIEAYNALALQFYSKGGEFQRIKRELLE